MLPLHPHPDRNTTNGDILKSQPVESFIVLPL